MMKYGAFTQIAVAIIAIVIVFTYVRPTFTEIGEIQDKIAEFDAAIEKVSAVNNQLANLVSQVNSVSVEERQALLTFMPDHIDYVAIQRDIQSMAEASEVELMDLAYSGFDIETATEEDGVLLQKPVVHEFQVNVQGEYGNVKQFLRNLEENDYPLHVYMFDGTLADSEAENLEEIEVGLLIETYSRLEPEQFQPAGNSR